MASMSTLTLDLAPANRNPKLRQKTALRNPSPKKLVSTKFPKGHDFSGYLITTPKNRTMAKPKGKRKGKPKSGQSNTSFGMTQR